MKAREGERLWRDGVSRNCSALVVHGEFGKMNFTAMCLHWAAPRVFENTPIHGRFHGKLAQCADA
jgi:hypothetical protein